MMAGITTDALNTAFQIVTTIMRQQIERKLKLIRSTSMIRRISRTGEHCKLLFWTPGQYQRSLRSISDGKSFNFEFFANTIRLIIARVMPQRLTLTYLPGNLSRNGLQIHLWIALLEGPITQEIVLEIKTKNTIKVEKQTHTRRRIAFLRAQHSPDNRHRTRHIQIVLNFGQKRRLPGIGR